MDYGCIGEHLIHSYSKEIHLCFADYKYELKEIPKPELHRFLTERNFKAINVTIPYKKDVIPYLYEISDTAKSIGAVNTVVNNGGKLFGYNTDFYGMTALINKAKINFSGKTVLVLGSGGTSQTADAVAKALNAKRVIKVSRTEKPGCINYEQMYRSFSGAEIIINTTPCGMFPNTNACPVDINKFSNLNGVIDAIYNPLNSILVQSARKKGITAVGGLYMLVAQAAYAAEKFINTKIPVSKIEETYQTILRQKENIVLIGMPGSGKSTVGKAVAKKLNKPFFDTDDLIVSKLGMSIPEIFEKYGEDYFRKTESEVIIESAGSISGAVIATGGGAVLNRKNVEFLKMNGRLCFLDRPLSFLKATSDRPLSSTAEALEQRYNERYETYVSSSDVIIKASDILEDCVNEIISKF